MHRPALLLMLIALPAHAWEAQPLQSVAEYPQRTAQAQVVSLNESKVATELTARVVRLAVEPGQRVARSGLIAQLDCRDYDLASERAAAALRSAEARARLAELQLGRTQQLAAEGFVSQGALDAHAAEHDSARAEVGVNAAALKTTRATQAKCTVRAPFPAIVLERLAQEGEIVSAGAPLASLLDTSRIEVRAEIQESDIASLPSARDLALITAAGRYPLQLTRVSPALGKTSRLAEARLRFSSRSAAPGASGRVVWSSPEMHVPAKLLVRRQGQLGVFVAAAADNSVKPRFLALPHAQEGRPARATGLRADSRIVVRGSGEL